MWTLHPSSPSLACRLGAMLGFACALGLAPSLARAQYACPYDWRDAGAPIDDPQPVAPPGVPEAEIDALHAFATAEGLGSAAELLAALPGCPRRLRHAPKHLLASSGLAGPIRVEIHGTSSTGPGTIYAGNRITLGFSRDAPSGPLYFWSAATSGVMRGGLDVVTAGKLYPSSTTCVGCHAVSRDGAMMAMGYDDTISIDLQTIALGSLATQIGAQRHAADGMGNVLPRWLAHPRREQRHPDPLRCCHRR